MHSQDLSNRTPTRRWSAALTATTGLALVATLAGTGSAAATQQATRQASQHASVVRASLAQAADSTDYTPSPGPLFNDPLSNKHARDISYHIRASIQSVPKGERIRIFSWNIKSNVFVNALVNAHKRGVSVRVLMSNGLAEGQTDQGSYKTLKRELSQHQASRRPSQKSWVRTCENSCRGKSGAAHSKFFLFSKVGDRSDVVMVGSPNLTQPAALNQWNELITFTDRPSLYQAYLDVFLQASMDQPVTPPYVERTEGDITSWFTPYTGPPEGDPVISVLNNVHCSGATHGSGVSGFTKVRIAADTMVGERGLRVAERIRTMSDRGCNVKLLYTIVGKRIARTLFDKAGKGPVRAQHYVQDLDCDGAYDNYLHMKSISISGNYGAETDNHIVLNGSNNWSGFGAASDDAGLIVKRQTVEKKYTDWINRLWATKPPYHGGQTCPTTTDTTTSVPTLRVAADGGWGPNHEALTPATAWKYRNILN